MDWFGHAGLIKICRRQLFRSTMAIFICVLAAGVAWLARFLTVRTCTVCDLPLTIFFSSAVAVRYNSSRFSSNGVSSECRRLLRAAVLS